MLCSEGEAQAESHDSGFRSALGQALGLSELTAAQVALDAVKIRVIEHVLRIHAEAQVDGFSEFERLVNSQIEASELGPMENVPAKGPETKVSRARRGIARSHKQGVWRRDAKA